MKNLNRTKEYYVEGHFTPTNKILFTTYAREIASWRSEGKIFSYSSNGISLRKKTYATSQIEIEDKEKYFNTNFKEETEIYKLIAKITSLDMDEVSHCIIRKQKKRVRIKN